MTGRKNRRGRDRGAPPAPAQLPEQPVDPGPQYDAGHDGAMRDLAAAPGYAATEYPGPATEYAVPYEPGTSIDAADRATLIRACIYLRDRITSTALAQRLDQALAEVGVVTLNPVGEPFDPTWQEAAGVEATHDPAHVEQYQDPPFVEQVAVVRALDGHAGADARQLRGPGREHDLSNALLAFGDREGSNEADQRV